MSVRNTARQAYAVGSKSWSTRYAQRGAKATLACPVSTLALELWSL